MKAFLCLAALLALPAVAEAGPLDRIRANREARAAARVEKCQECEAASTPATAVPAAKSPVSAVPATLASPCAGGSCPSPAKSSFRIFRR